MKCWFCEETARGTCAACGRGLCYNHAHQHDEMTLAKSDTSTGYARAITTSYRALKCSDCRLGGRPSNRESNDSRRGEVLSAITGTGAGVA